MCSALHVTAKNLRNRSIACLALVAAGLIWLLARRSRMSSATDTLQGDMSGGRPDEKAHQEGLQAFLTPERRQLIDELEAIAFEMGSVEMCQRIGIAAEERYEGHHHITQLLVRKNLKQGEFAEELVCALRDGRTGVALALTRTLLEGGVELSWAADSQLRKDTPEERLLRILRRGYEAIAEVGSLPPSEQAVLDDITQRGLKLSPESARNAMEQMDAAEVRAGGDAYWESHYKQFEISSDYVHTSLLGPARFAIVGDNMEIDMNPTPRKGWLRCDGACSTSCAVPTQFCGSPAWTRTPSGSWVATPRSGSWRRASWGRSSVSPPPTPRTRRRGNAYARRSRSIPSARQNESQWPILFWIRSNATHSTRELPLPRRYGGALRSAGGAAHKHCATGRRRS